MQIVASPTDLVKVRLQAYPERYQNKHLGHVFSEIVRQEGVVGLFRGIVPNASRAALVVSILCTRNNKKPRKREGDALQRPRGLVLYSAVLCRTRVSCRFTTPVREYSVKCLMSAMDISSTSVLRWSAGLERLCYPAPPTLLKHA